MKEFTKIRERLGIDAFDEICNILFKLQMRIEDLEKSRDNWKNKYMKLKHGK